MKMFCFGFGYTAAVVADRMATIGFEVAGTRTSAASGDPAIVAFRGDGPGPEVSRALGGATHVLVSIPPDIEGDPTLRHHAADLAALPELAWIGYLSTIGVYGDTQGAWVDESSPVRPGSERALRRQHAERAWRTFAEDTGRRVEIFRLPGIYGPGRSVIDALRSGTARRIVKPGQVFNRIHVGDLATVLAAAMAGPARHDLYNVADDEPAPPEDVVAYAADLLGLPLPPTVPFADARLSPMAASFYAECKRVRNDRIKRAYAIELAYPTYREGLLSLLDGR